MTSPTKEQLSAIATYGEIIGEVKVRTQAIMAAVNRETILAPPIARELGFLQLRMICELIALGCLVAHGDMVEVQSSRLQKEYAADKIMKRLSELHPRFYPQPIEIHGRTGGKVKITDSELEHMDKERLIGLYTRCGGHLHKGSLKSLTSKPNRVPPDWEADMTREVQLVANLLGNHAIVLFGDSGAIFCNLASGNVAFSVAMN